MILNGLNHRVLTTLLIASAVAKSAFGQGTVDPAAASSAAVPPLAHYEDSWAEYQALKAAAHGGSKMTWHELPDWTGLWTREPRAGLKFDASQKGQGETTATPSPEYQKRLDKKLADFKKGVEWDQLSFCLPAGYPRWLAEPFLKEFVLRPEETWLINEQLEEIRRIYTDGRGHVDPADAYPLWEGDSVGFWNRDVLVIHTNNLKHGQFQRLQPDYSDQVSTVEQWRKVGPDMIQDIVDVYDPVALAKPWRVVQRYVRVKTPDLRINYWSCEENNNVVPTPDGGTQFLLPGEKGYKDPDTLQDTLGQSQVGKDK
jgi:hypothetical protein